MPSPLNTHRSRRRAAVGAIALVAVAMALVATVYATLSAVAPRPAAAAETPIAVGNLWFCDSLFQNDVCETTIKVGDTVVWEFSGADHTTTESEGGPPVWDSGTITDGSTFQLKFNDPGTFNYLCTIHPGPMRGRIIVLTAQEQTTATAAATSPPTATATATSPPTATEAATETPTPPVATSTPAPGTDTPTPTVATSTPAPGTDTPTPTVATNTPAPATDTPGLGKPCGDVNDDESTNSIDATLILQFNAGLLPALINPRSADVNGDGRIDSIDSALILQFVAGLLDMLDCP